MCFPVNSANIFLRTLFVETPPGVVFREHSKNFRNVFLMHCKNFPKVHKNTSKNMFPKYLSEDDCFVKTIILLTVTIATMLSVS